MLLHARDDPINSFFSIDWAAAARNKHLIAVTTKRGGHIGYRVGVRWVGALRLVGVGGGRWEIVARAAIAGGGFYVVVVVARRSVPDSFATARRFCILSSFSASLGLSLFSSSLSLALFCRAANGAIDTIGCALFCSSSPRCLAVVVAPVG